MKIKITLEMEVSDVPADDQDEFNEDGEFVSVSSYTAQEIAELLETDDAPEMWQEHMAGSSVWAKIDRTIVLSSEIIEE